MHAVAVTIGILVVWAPVVAVAAPRVFRGEVRDTGLLTQGLTRLVITFCIYSIVSALIDRATRRWSRWPGAGVFLVVSLLLGVVIFSAVGDSRRASQREALRKTAESKLDVLFALNGRGASDDEYHKAAAESDKEVKALAATLPARDAAASLIEFEVTEELLETGRPYLKSLAACRATGMSVADVHSKADVDERLGLYRAAKADHEKIMAFLQETPVKTSRRITEAGISANDPQASRFLSKLGPEGKTFKGHEFEEQMLKAQIRAWEVLSEAWGEWQVQNGQVLFSGPKAAERLASFNEAQTTMQSAVRSQNELYGK
jgi:hypothetical protein